MRRGRSLLPPATDAISLTIGNFHDASLNARRFDKNVYPAAMDRDNVFEADPIYLHHPSPRQDLQSPLALTPLSPAHSPVLIENQYLTGVHSAKDPNVSTYTIFMYLQTTPTIRPSSKQFSPTTSPTCNPPDSPRLRRDSMHSKFKKIQHTQYNPSKTTNPSPTQPR